MWLDHLVEDANGNRSPAVTVAQTHGLTPDNVRKIVQRVREKLGELAETDEHYADLAHLVCLPALAA